MATRLEPIALDIETTGFSIQDQLTVIGFALQLGCRVFLQTDHRNVDADTLERQLEAEFETTIKLSTHPSEAELISAVHDFVQTRLATKEYLLTGYNAERYRGGFDLPFLRTRFSHHDAPWPFTGLPYADLIPIYKTQFNTTIDDVTATDLEGVYAALIDDGLTEKDPFDDSAEAVHAFEDGHFEPLVKHNIADILRTDALAKLAQRYCSKSDFKLKSLTATIDDPALSSK